MRYIKNIVIAMLLLAPYHADAKSSGVVGDARICGIGGDYTANAAAIAQTKQDMLAIADRAGNFWFSDDAEFQSQDPHAYWLMNRMMQMVQLVQTADDAWG